mmetsp:Transcript_50043/g.141040  ORF Transcript_50043/g.141040 Transcript_50043/m.141040 type:complete len:240 (+) Transcript_50043:165-884(+)
MAAAAVAASHTRPHRAVVVVIFLLLLLLIVVPACQGSTPSLACLWRPAAADEAEHGEHAQGAAAYGRGREGRGVARRREGQGLPEAPVRRPVRAGAREVAAAPAPAGRAVVGELRAARPVRAGEGAEAIRHVRGQAEPVLGALPGRHPARTRGRRRCQERRGRRGGGCRPRRGRGRRCCRWSCRRRGRCEGRRRRRRRRCCRRGRCGCRRRGRCGGRRGRRGCRCGGRCEGRRRGRRRR